MGKLQLLLIRVRDALKIHSDPLLIYLRKMVNCSSLADRIASCHELRKYQQNLLQRTTNTRNITQLRNKERRKLTSKVVIKIKIRTSPNQRSKAILQWVGKTLRRGPRRCKLCRSRHRRRMKH